MPKNAFVRQYGDFTYVLERVKCYDQMFKDAEVFMRWITRVPIQKTEILKNICSVYVAWLADGEWARLGDYDWQGRLLFGSDFPAYHAKKRGTFTGLYRKQLEKFSELAGKSNVAFERFLNLPPTLNSRIRALANLQQRICFLWGDTLGYKRLEEHGPGMPLQS